MKNVVIGIIAALTLFATSANAHHLGQMMSQANEHDYSVINFYADKIEKKIGTMSDEKILDQVSVTVNQLIECVAFWDASLYILGFVEQGGGPVDPQAREVLSINASLYKSHIVYELVAMQQIFGSRFDAEAYLHQIDAISDVNMISMAATLMTDEATMKQQTAQHKLTCDPVYENLLLINDVAGQHLPQQEEETIHHEWEYEKTRPLEKGEFLL